VCRRLVLERITEDDAAIVELEVAGE